MSPLNTADPYATTIFWKVRAPSGAQGFILGLFHSSEPQLLAKWDAFQTLAYSSDLYFAETELDPAALQQMATAMRSGADLVSPTLLALKGDARKALDHILAERDLTLEDLKGQTDWALFSNLSRPLDHGQTIDELLYSERVQMHKPIVPLQTMAELISDLKQFPYSAHVLLDTICGYDQARAQAKAMTRDLMAGNWSDLFAESQRWQSPTAAVSDAFEERLVNQRNAEMARRLAQNLKSPDQTFLVSLGAAHLPGPRGLMARLKALGFEVEPTTLAVINAQARGVQEQVVGQAQKQMPQLLQLLAQFSKSPVSAGVPPRLQFLDPISFYVQVCGGYSCPVQTFYSQNKILLKTELIDQVASGDPTVKAMILKELVHWDQEQKRDSPLAVWCATWNVREIEANSVKASYLRSINRAVGPFNLGPQPPECR